MESDSRPMDATTAAAELAELQADRAALAERAVQPWWYDVLLGVVVFVFLGSYATGNWWLIGAGWLFAGLGLWGLITVYRRLTGFWVNGLREGPTQRAMRVWFWCCVSWGAVAMVDVIVEEAFTAWLLGAVSAACGVAVVLVSRWWTRIYVAELRGEL